MNFITKYLPVEGEIISGKPYWSATTNSVRICTCIMPGDQVWFSGSVYQDNSKDSKPVKLFLCSKDIQVGDKVQTDGINGDDWEVVATHADLAPNKVSLFEALKRKSFKVIGEISTEAIWVKEGDEFTDESVQKLVLLEVYCADWEIQYSNIDKILNVNETYQPKGVHGKDTYIEDIIFETIQIKCPTCQLFH